MKVQKSDTPALELLAVILLGIIAFVLFAWGINIYKYATSTHEVGLRFLGAALVAIPVVFAFFLCHYWAKWIAPASAYVIARSLFFMILGHSLTPPFRPISRVVILAGIAVFLLIATVTYPYFRKAPQLLDRFFLSIFFVSIPCSFLLNDLEQVALLLLGITPVAIIYVYHRVHHLAALIST